MQLQHLLLLLLTCINQKAPTRAAAICSTSPNCWLANAAAASAAAAADMHAMLSEPARHKPKPLPWAAPVPAANAAAAADRQAAP
jgi:hypothetical protein